ncbi:hypothetical protein CBR_g8901 [Chara braunii]|uniref:SKP1 component dimerisation domain-containing protein n=1 Tax=Chara braunii TaxID=69332 RepID=A0A388KN78_CHABU|nr:hypothetical protein CBR_g8901 [Chara braunii]|eukprot:GBG71485.1 hypothetical protein CBR_g8901 [Chara braunii]
MKGAKAERTVAKANGVAGHGNVKVAAMAAGSGNSTAASSQIDGPAATALNAVVKASEVVPKGTVWLETVDGDVEEVERDVAVLSPVIHRDMLRFGRGSSRESPIVLPKQVSSGVLKLILEYCRFHKVHGRSDKERKLFDERFIRLDTRRLCELTSAADSLDMKPLVDLTSRALARMIEGKTAEEIRETFHLPDDLTEEEKLEPVKNATDDPRIRLLNRLYARKREELQKKKVLKGGSADTDDKPRDERSVDDLLSFIENEGMSEGKKAGKGKKRKNRRKKEQVDEQSLTLLEDDKEKGKRKGFARSDEGSSNGCRSSSRHEAASGMYSLENGQEGSSCLAEQVTGAGRTVRHPLTGTLALLPSGAGEGETPEDDVIFDEAEFDDDDGMDPAMREKLDREVADFARRLNSDWQDRMQELLALASSSHEMRQRAMGGSNSLLGQSARCVTESDKRVTGKNEGERRHQPINDMRKEKERLHRKIKKMKKLQKQQHQLPHQQQQHNQQQQHQQHHQQQQQQHGQQKEQSALERSSDVGLDSVQRSVRSVGGSTGEGCGSREEEEAHGLWQFSDEKSNQQKTRAVVSAVGTVPVATTAGCGAGPSEGDCLGPLMSVRRSQEGLLSGGCMDRALLYSMPVMVAHHQTLANGAISGDLFGTADLVRSATSPEGHVGMMPGLVTGWHYYAAGPFMNGLGCTMGDTDVGGGVEGARGGVVALNAGGAQSANGIGHGSVGPFTLVTPVMNGYSGSSFAYIPQGGLTNSLLTRDKNFGSDGKREPLGLDIGCNLEGMGLIRTPREGMKGWLALQEGGCKSESIGGSGDESLSRWARRSGSLQGEGEELVSFLELLLQKINMQDEVEVGLKGACSSEGSEGMMAASRGAKEDPESRVENGGQEVDDVLDVEVERPRSEAGSSSAGEGSIAVGGMGTCTPASSDGRLTGEGWTICRQFKSGVILSVTLVDARSTANDEGGDHIDLVSQGSSRSLLEERGGSEPQERGGEV